MHAKRVGLPLIHPFTCFSGKGLQYLFLYFNIWSYHLGSSAISCYLYVFAFSCPQNTWPLTTSETIWKRTKDKTQVGFIIHLDVVSVSLDWHEFQVQFTGWCRGSAFKHVYLHGSTHSLLQTITFSVICSLNPGLFALERKQFLEREKIKADFKHVQKCSGQECNGKTVNCLHTNSISEGQISNSRFCVVCFPHRQKIKSNKIISS